MNKFLPFLILIAALIISIISSYYSVVGLSKLFSGAKISVIIMAIGFELSKLVIALALHEYWKKFNLLLKGYLISALIVLVIITSLGIYGYLSSAFKNTYNIELISSREIQLKENRKSLFENQLIDYYLERDNLITSISELRSALSGNVIQYIDRATGNLITTTSSANRRSFELQLEDAINRRDDVLIKIQDLNDSISKYDIQIIDLRNNSDQTTDLATLQFVAQISNLDINLVVHYFILVIIFVFDPLALTLVITSNYTYKLYFQRNDNVEIDVKKEDLDDLLNTLRKKKI